MPKAFELELIRFIIFFYNNLKKLTSNCIK
jgi:hypothetical protein